MAVEPSLCGQDRQGPGADIGNAAGPLTRLPGSPGLGTAGGTRAPRARPRAVQTPRVTGKAGAGGSGARGSGSSPTPISGAFGRRGPQPGVCPGSWREGEAPPERLCAFLLPGWAHPAGSSGALGAVWSRSLGAVPGVETKGKVPLIVSRLPSLSSAKLQPRG